MTARLKVLHIITGLNDGGAEAVLTRLCLNDQACRHYVVSLMGMGKHGLTLQSAGVDTFCLEMAQGRFNLFSLWRMWRLIRRLEPDVVQTWMYHADLLGGVAARLAGVKKVFWGIRHNDLVADRSKKSTVLVARICAFLSQWLPSAIISCSEQAVKNHSRFGYRADKFVVVPNGYDLTYFLPQPGSAQELRNQFNLSERRPILGMVGRFAPQKDHRTLFKALTELRDQGADFSVVLVGHGISLDNEPLRQMLKEFRLTPYVHLLGSRKDIPIIMSALDIHVLSSNSEAFPNVLAEAMACGTPCVTTDAGDAAEIVGETGWVVHAGDSQALAKGIAEALALKRDPELWQHRCHLARERIKERFKLKSMIEGYHHVWFQH